MIENNIFSFPFQYLFRYLSSCPIALANISRTNLNDDSDSGVIACY